MAYPVVVDGRNAFDSDAMRKAGITYYPTGRVAVPGGSDVVVLPSGEVGPFADRRKGGAMRARAVVTGGAGFVGSHLCDRLLAEGWDVVAVDSLLTGNEANLAEARGASRFRFIQADVSQHFEVDGHVDWILHFASPASPRDYFEHPIKTMKVGALGTINCLGLARVKGAGLLLASTSEVYGDPKVHPQPESYWGK